MGRKKDDAVMEGMSKRLEARHDTVPLASASSEERIARSQEPSPSKPKRKPAREDKHFIGFYAETEMKEKLRVLAFETRRQHQDLMQEAMALLFTKYGSSR